MVYHIFLQLQYPGSPPFDIFSDWLMDFASIAASGMGRTDWENFRRLVLVHVGKCRSSKCWYCYNDAWEDEPNPKCEFGKKTASQIIAYFKAQQERDAKRHGWQCNVLRLSGGEPFLQPKLVEDLAKAIAEEKDIFFWVDTNLIPIISMGKDIENALIALQKLGNRTAIHCCFHGTTDDRLKETTGANISVEKLLRAYKLIIKRMKIPTYPRINPCTCTPQEAENFFLKLFDIDRVAPAKVYLGPIELYYKVTRDHMIKVNNDPARVKPHLNATTATIFWWDKLMHLCYGIGYGVVPRHLCDSLSVYHHNPSQIEQKLQSEKLKRPDHEFIFVSKGSYRENYALKVLEALALPSGAKMILELQEKYVEPNFLHYADIFQDNLIGKDVLIVATHSKGRGMFHLTFLRWAKLLRIWVNPTAINLSVELREYPEEGWDAGDGKDNYDFLATYCGQRNLPIDGYYCQMLALPLTWSPAASRYSSGTEQVSSDDKKVLSEKQAEGFLRAVKRLNEVEDEKVKKNVYYRVARVSRRTDTQSTDVKFVDGELQFYPGDLIEVQIDTFNQNLGVAGYPREETAVLQVFSTEEERVKIVSQRMIRLSKFGRPVVKLKIVSEYREFRGEIVFQPVNLDFN